MITKKMTNSLRPERRKELIAVFVAGDRASEAFVPPSQMPGDRMMVTVFVSQMKSIFHSWNQTPMPCFDPVNHKTNSRSHFAERAVVAKAARLGPLPPSSEISEVPVPFPGPAALPWTLTSLREMLGFQQSRLVCET